MPRIAAAAAGLALILIASSPAAAQQAPAHVTVPLIIEYNRPYVELTFRKPDGSTRKARFLIDTGGGAFSMAEPLAREIGVEIGQVITPEGKPIGLAKAPPEVSIAGFPLELSMPRVGVNMGESNVMPTEPVRQFAEGLLPGHVLAKYHVVFDYPRKQFTIAKPGVLTPSGTMLPMPVGRTGFPRTEVVVGDSTYGLLLDTGAAFTLVSDRLLQSLGTAHPSWKRFAGADGEAAWLGGRTMETMYLPAVSWGGFALSDVGVTSQPTATFERGLSGVMAAPVVGSLAGNVLRNFRIELDYANQKLYISR